MPLTLIAELLLRRARHAGARWLLVALAIALAGVPLAVAPAVARTTAAEALRRGVGELPPGQRSVIASYSGLPDAAAQARVDAAARSALAALGARGVLRQILFGELADRAGRPFRLAVTDDLASVTLVSGRLPGACAPGHCEVAELESTTGGPGAAGLALDPALGLVVVGRVARADPLLLSGTFDPGPSAPVLLAAGLASFRAPVPLAEFSRSYGWVSGWDPDRVLSLGVDAWIARAARAGAALAAVAPGAVLTAPDQVLREQDERARLSAERLGLLAAGSCAVLLGAAVAGGTALRRDHEGFAGALRLRGAGPGLIRALLVGEAGIAAALGAAGSLVAGAAVAAVLAARAGMPSGPAAWAALAAGFLPVLVLAVLAGAVVAAAVGLAAGEPGGRAGVWRALEAGAAGCLAAAALLAARGGVGAGGVGAGGPPSSDGDPLLTALPLLVLTAAALLTARGWPPVIRFAQRLPPRRALGLRLGLASAAGRPARPAATAGVLAAAVATAVFAGAYAATLDRGAAEQAAHAVPLDARLLPGPSQASPLSAVEPAALASALPGSTAYPVVRVAGSVRIGAQQADAVQFLGLDPQVLPRIARWAAQTGGGTDPAALARRLAAGPAPSPRRLPAGSVLAIATPARVQVAVGAYVRAPDGREREVPLAGGADGGLTGSLPALRDAAGALAPLDLVAVAVRLPTDVADRRQHALGEGTSDQAVSAGSLTLGALRVDGTPMDRPWTGWSGPAGGAAQGGAAVQDGGATLRLAYQLGTGPTVVVPPSTTGTVPVITDAATAASADGGLLTLLLDGLPFPARPVAATAGFPSLQGRFAVLDARALADLLQRTEPGAASPAEVWIDAGPARARLATAAAVAPLDRLDVRLRSSLEQSLRSDPVARSATFTLEAGAALALAVALAAVALLVVAERTDEAAVHYAWEADGVAPRTLRAALWWSAVAVVLPGAVAGTATGLGLAASAARLVAVTATATTPEPPLRVHWWDGEVLGATAAGLVGMLVLAGLAAAASLREPVPVRRPGGLP